MMFLVMLLRIRHQRLDILHYPLHLRILRAFTGPEGIDGLVNQSDIP